MREFFNKLNPFKARENTTTPQTESIEPSEPKKNGLSRRRFLEVMGISLAAPVLGKIENTFKPSTAEAAPTENETEESDTPTVELEYDEKLEAVALQLYQQAEYSKTPVTVTLVTENGGERTEEDSEVTLGALVRGFGNDGTAQKIIANYLDEVLVPPFMDTSTHRDKGKILDTIVQENMWTEMDTLKIVATIKASKNDTEQLVKDHNAKVDNDEEKERIPTDDKKSQQPNSILLLAALSPAKAALFPLTFSPEFLTDWQEKIIGHHIETDDADFLRHISYTKGERTVSKDEKVPVFKPTFKFNDWTGTVNREFWGYIHSENGADRNREYRKWQFDPQLQADEYRDAVNSGHVDN